MLAPRGCPKVKGIQEMSTQQLGLLTPDRKWGDKVRWCRQEVAPDPTVLAPPSSSAPVILPGWEPALWALPCLSTFLMALGPWVNNFSFHNLLYTNEINHPPQRITVRVE